MDYGKLAFFLSVLALFFSIVLGINEYPTYDYNNTNFVLNNLTINGNIKVLGNMSIKRPYGMFSDNLTQNLNAINMPYAVNFSNTEDNYEVWITNHQNFSVGQNGDYLIELSAITKSNTQNKRFEIWVRKNGIDIPRSNTIYDFKGVGTAAVISVTFILDLMINDTFTIMWAGDSTDILMFAVNATAHSPAAPSIIMTISKISEITP